jgi:hypothetical protein
MRHAILLSLLLVGCATAHMEVVHRGDNVRFDFGVGSKSARVMGIDVFEADAGKRGNTVCKLSRSVWTGPMDMQSWVYGTPIGWFQPVGCAPLAVDREYGVVVYESNRDLIFRRFRLGKDGSILTWDRLH